MAKLIKKKNNFLQILKRIKGLIKPKNIQIREISPNIKILKDVHIPTRDGTYLSANVYLPPYSAKVPVLVCLHPAQKDVVCKNGYMHIQFRFARIPGTVSISNETSFEAPDPDYWVNHGYAIVNIDKRGFGLSPKAKTPQVYFGKQEIEDIYDAIEWAGIQDWSNGNVGMFGVSYLAINQYKVAEMHPPHLKAIVPWEGTSDLYKDWFYPGGVKETGFSPFLFGRLKSWGDGFDMKEKADEHPLRDEWWQAFVPDFSKIDQPILNCVSFSTQMFHSRGSYRVYQNVSSQHKWLFTHRGGEWTEYYNNEVTSVVLKFFDYFLKGIDNGMLEHPKVRLEVREFGDKVKEVRYEEQFPPSNVSWHSLYLNGETQTMTKGSPSANKVRSFDLKNEHIKYSYFFPRDTEIIGPMNLTLFLQLEGLEDANLFAGIQKFHKGKEITFEGLYGFANDFVAKTVMRVALRKKNEQISTAESPEHDFTTLLPVKKEEVVKVEFQFSPSATFFRKGDELRLILQGQWFINSFRIHQVFDYEGSAAGNCKVISSKEHPSALYLPMIEY